MANCVVYILPQFKFFVWNRNVRGWQLLRNKLPISAETALDLGTGSQRESHLQGMVLPPCAISISGTEHGEDVGRGEESASEGGT